MVNLLLFVLIVLRLVIGVRLLTVARQNALPNLNWLAAHFLVQAFGLAFAPTQGNPLGEFAFSLFMFIAVGTMTAIGLMIVFNHITFYQGKASPAVWIAVFSGVCWLATLYGVAISPSGYEQSAWVAAYIPTQFLILGWHGWLAYQAWQTVKQSNLTEDWVIARYQLIVTYVIAILIGAASSLVRILFAGGSAVTPLGQTTALIALVSQILTVVLQFLVWVMPEAFRRWLNRNQEAHTKERASLAALATLEIIGQAMTRDTRLVQIICGSAARDSIGKWLGTDDSTTIDRRISTMGYQDWEQLLNRKDFYNAIKLKSDPQADVEQGIENARQALIAHQSLFTMKAV